MPPQIPRPSLRPVQQTARLEEPRSGGNGILGGAPQTVERTRYGLQLRDPVLGLSQPDVLGSPSAEAWSDDRAGVAGLLGEIRPQVFGLALARTGDPDVAEDVT